VIGIKDLLHLSNNTLHPLGGLIYLKIDPRDKIECSRFSKKVMYNNFEKKKNSQLWNTASMHHPSMLGLGVHTQRSNGQRLFFLPHFPPPSNV